MQTPWLQTTNFDFRPFSTPCDGIGMEKEVIDLSPVSKDYFSVQINAATDVVFMNILTVEVNPTVPGTFTFKLRAKY